MNHQVLLAVLLMLAASACGASPTPPGTGHEPETMTSDRSDRSGRPELTTPLAVDEPVQIATTPSVRPDGSVALLFVSNTGADYLMERSPDGATRTEDLPMAVTWGALFDAPDAEHRLLHYDGAGQTRLSHGRPWNVIDEAPGLAGAPGSVARDPAGRVHTVFDGHELAVFDNGWTRRPLGLRCSVHGVALALPANGNDPHVACWSSQTGAWALHWVGPAGVPEQVTPGDAEALRHSRLALAVEDDGTPHAFFLRELSGQSVLQHAVRGPGGFQIETLASHPIPSECPPPNQLGEMCERTTDRALPLSAHYRRGVLELIFAEIRHDVTLRAVEEDDLQESYIAWQRDGQVTATVWLGRLESGQMQRQLLFEGPSPAFSPSASAAVDAAGRLHVAAVVDQKPRYAVVD